MKYIKLYEDVIGQILCIKTNTKFFTYGQKYELCSNTYRNVTSYWTQNNNGNNVELRMLNEHEFENSSTYNSLGRNYLFSNDKSLKDYFKRKKNEEMIEDAERYNL